jgi:benzoylformate decarboxylase
MTVREATRALLRELGATTVFGNPGSTELRFLKDWPDDFRYVMALHEGASVAMADAYAQITGRAALVNLHSAGGVGNGIGTLFTAFRNNAPMVVLAGQQTRAMLPSVPFLAAADPTMLPQPYVKFAVEPARPQDVPAAIARAFAVAMTRPYGPTFVSVPEDDWDRECEPIAAYRIIDDAVMSDDAVREVVAALGTSRTPALIVGAGVDRDGASAQAVALAEGLGARVWSSALTGRCAFPEDHPLFAGALPRSRSGVRETLAGRDCVIVLGAPVFLYHVHTEGEHVEPGTAIYQLTDDPDAASYAVIGTRIITALRPALDALLAAVPSRDAAAMPARAFDGPPPSDPISVEFLLAALRRAMPADAILVEEAPSVHSILHDTGLLQPQRFFTAASGSLGYGLPAATGAALAAPGRPIVALIGDGSAHYGIQGLWTTAQFALPITYVIVNNGGYGAMQAFTRVMGSTRSPDFMIPDIDFAGLAAGYGVRSQRITAATDLEPALHAAIAGGKPMLLDVAIDPAIRAIR